MQARRLLVVAAAALTCGGCGGGGGQAVTHDGSSTSAPTTTPESIIETTAGIPASTSSTLVSTDRAGTGIEVGWFVPRYLPEGFAPTSTTRDLSRREDGLVIFEEPELEQVPIGVDQEGVVTGLGPDSTVTWRLRWSGEELYDADSVVTADGLIIVTTPDGYVTVLEPV